ncbi:sporulation membrane protein YtrI [Oceanobacillus saliphilus]|uniref:sporulation membrane protein YtrI n=1 Tax=Oceanobacillus saliphilus TaxID=2925834 RepID=UPI00201DB93C|nr:sporulation membrane protein YtrI [Oceanobacillus saliphilus]
MHIPPYYRKPGWQRFFAGAFFGGIISYLILIYMYGTMYEQLLTENMEINSELSDLKKENEALLKDKEDLSEKQREPLTVSSISIRIVEGESLKMDRLIELQLEGMLKEEISHLIGQEIEMITKSDQLLESAIENKGFTIEDVNYYFEVKKITIASELEINVIPKLSN